MENSQIAKSVTCSEMMIALSEFIDQCGSLPVQASGTQWAIGIQAHGSGAMHLASPYAFLIEAVDVQSPLPLDTFELLELISAFVRSNGDHPVFFRHYRTCFDVVLGANPVLENALPLSFTIEVTAAVADEHGNYMPLDQGDILIPY